MVHKNYILLICSENMPKIDVGQSSVTKVLVDKSPCKFDAKHHTFLLMENNITKSFKDVLVILICCDIVDANKGVKEIQMTE